MRTWLFRVGLALGGGVLALLLAELTLRLLGISYPQLYAPDEYCGSRLRPGAAGWWLKEGRAYVRISSAGLRDHEHTRAKPPRTFRVAVLGDSFAEALQVAAPDTFWAVAEGELTTCGALQGRRVEFINFGVSGYGTAQELLTLRHNVWQFDPDLVLLAVCHNDLQDNSSQIGGREPKPYFDLHDDQLVLDDSFRKSAAYRAAQTKYEQYKARLINASYVLQVLKQAKMNWHVVQETRQAPPLAGRMRDMATANNLYAPPESEAEVQAWELTEKLIVQVAREVADAKTDFALMTITTPLQVYPDPQVRAAAASACAAEDLFYLEGRLRQLGADQGFPVLALGPSLQVVADENKLFLHGFPNTSLGSGHWNETGHRLAGQFLAEWLCELLDR